MNGRLLAFLAWPLVFAGATPALAWGDIGHRSICEIAFQELNNIARERVTAMVRRDPEFNTFAEPCSWPQSGRRAEGAGRRICASTSSSPDHGQTGVAVQQRRVGRGSNMLVEISTA